MNNEIVVDLTELRCQPHRACRKTTKTVYKPPRKGQWMNETYLAQELCGKEDKPHASDPLLTRTWLDKLRKQEVTEASKENARKVLLGQEAWSVVLMCDRQHFSPFVLSVDDDGMGRLLHYDSLADGAQDWHAQARDDLMDLVLKAGLADALEVIQLENPPRQRGSWECGFVTLAVSKALQGLDKQQVPKIEDLKAVIQASAIQCLKNLNK